MRAHFRHLRSKSFPMIQRTPQDIEFWPLKSVFEILGVHWDSFSQSGSCLGSVKAHSLTLSYTPGSLWCDSRASPRLAPLQPLLPWSRAQSQGCDKVHAQSWNMVLPHRCTYENFASIDSFVTPFKSSTIPRSFVGLQGLIVKISFGSNFPCDINKSPLLTIHVKKPRL
jgi:hypothetical protein